jgi:uncharacterized membrane protein
MVGLGDLTGGGFGSRANAASGDGSVIVGRSDAGVAGVQTAAFYWTEALGMRNLKDLAALRRGPAREFRSSSRGEHEGARRG